VSLLVGGGAGVGGAAAYTAWHDDGTASSSSGGAAPTTSKVVSTPSSPAPDGSVQAVAAKVLPSVVKIDVSGAQGAGSGSGIVLSSDGRILTNNHVVALAGDGGTLRVTFNDGTHADAKVLGTDPLTDTALIQAQNDQGENVSGLTPATIGTSGDLAVGQSVVAIGSPLGLEATVTSGIVSALNRPVDVGAVSQGNSTVYPAIQTDAAINPGNSGGALVDLNGNVVGINAAIATANSGGLQIPGQSQQSGSIGIGFAIPSDEAGRIANELISTGKATHAVIGVQVNASSNGQSANATLGATLSSVQGGTPAAKAGLRAGDVITAVGQQRIEDADGLIAAVRSHAPNDKVRITYTRAGKTNTVEVTLASSTN
jgi:putative serine protease PepD